ncbi:50S ribosomal protein L25 [Rubellicoccus peritrichatus]|uniref:Large ribosomal subunit protein bL25 n=1 Tax=Rubellicoccus peritrichatus TaxID=3080537 RepID=A0AAQ3LFD4_9BACT|nr:50S ribosomal protein L25 [Puniceicoccus sp. CR14]WOO43687.1 50S ribosomal protein L25 [Puniceicoccus sp. CR14]
MSQQTLSVKSREGIGRGHSRRLRAQGMIPAVIYGKSGNRNFSVAERDFRMLMREVSGGAALITLKNEDSGESLLSVVQATQRNSLTDRFEHIDFHEVTRGEKMTGHIPVHTTGEPVGVKVGGGVLDVVIHEVEIVCLPKDLPESIEIDVSGLDVGQAIHISELPALKGIEYHGDPSAVVVTIAGKTTEEEAAPAEEVAADSVEATSQKGDAEQDEKADS